MNLAQWIVTIGTSGALVFAQGGCSRGAPRASDQPPQMSSAQTATLPAALRNACDRKLVSEADVAGLLSEPIKSIAPLVGDAQSCQFISTDDSSVTVSLRPGLGDVTLAEIASGQTSQTVTPLHGVGEKAVWNAVLKEVNATKDNLLCDIGVVGPASGPATPEKLGALCNKIFAAS
jgi:hypothetical protein